MQFELSIMSKLNDDALQIVEQILPFFQPAFNLSVELIDQIKEKRDIPIILENITMQDDYEGDYSTRRVLLYTLRFTAKTYLFGPVTRVEPIKQATLSYYTDSAEKRDLAYKVTPRAVKDYDDSVVTNLSADILSSATSITVDDASNITADTYFEIDSESVYIKKVTGNKITIDRARDNTIAKDHVKGTALKSITQADNDLIEIGDDFGFDGDTFF